MLACAGALAFVAPLAERAPAAGADFEWLYEPTSPSLLIDYVYDLAFSRRDGYPADTLVPAKGLPVRIEFAGKPDSNQFVNRWGDKMNIRFDGGIDGTNLAFVQSIMGHFSHMAGKKVTMVDLGADNITSADGNFRIDDSHILLGQASGFDHLKEMRTKAVAQYKSALENQNQNLENITSLFMSPEGDVKGKGCFYIGAIDSDHVIRSGMIVIIHDLGTISWLSCYLQGNLRFFGFLGGGGLYPSSLRNSIGMPDLNLYERLALEIFYRPDIDNGMTVEDAMEAVRGSIR